MSRPLRARGKDYLWIYPLGNPTDKTNTGPENNSLSPHPNSSLPLLQALSTPIYSLAGSLCFILFHPPLIGYLGYITNVNKLTSKFSGLK